MRCESLQASGLAGACGPPPKGSRRSARGGGAGNAAQTATFVITGLLVGVLAASLRERLPDRRASKLAVALLGLLSAALMLAAFPVDVPMHTALILGSADCRQVLNVSRLCRSWAGNRHGRHGTLWGGNCQQHPGECVRNSQGGPEAEIGVRRQRPAHYQEQDAERERQQQEQTGPANAGAPPPPHKGLPYQYRSHHQHQERDQEDRVASSLSVPPVITVKSSMPLPKAIAPRASAEARSPASPNRPNRSRSIHRR
jgi:hypothetical protein